MLTDEQTKTAYELLEQADQAFEAGDWKCWAPPKSLWDALRQIQIGAIARAAGIALSTMTVISMALGRLSDSWKMAATR